MKLKLVRTILGASLAFLLTAVSCIPEEESARTIVLSAPEENAAFDLAAVQSITFEWHLLDDISKYKIAFSLSEDMIPSATAEATGSPYAMPVAELDGILKTIGMSNGATDTVYWSVRSNPILLNIETQVRPLVLTRKPLPPITILTPADGVTVDVNSSTFPRAFTWEFHEEISAYTVLFSTDAGFPDGQTVVVDRGDNNNYTLSTAREFDQLLQQTGIGINESATVYWTVVATGSVAGDGTPRAFTGVRLNTPLLRPENGQEVKLDHKTGSATALTFEWDNAANATVELIVGTTADLSGGVTIYSGNGTTKAFTHDELQTLLISAGLKRYYANNLYWNVRIGGNFITANAGNFQLSGQRVLVDVRGDESITYEVTVIETADYRAVWMAEGLRTKKRLDGTDISAYVYEAPPSSSYDYAAAGLPSGHVAPGDNPRTGYYYKPSWTPAFLLDDDLPTFVPAGWAMPTKAQYDALYLAACTSPEGYMVMLDPVAYNNSMYGAWGLNFAPNGYWEDYSPDGNNYDHYNYEVYGWLFVKVITGNGSSYHYVSCESIVERWRWANIRFIYIGE